MCQLSQHFSISPPCRGKLDLSPRFLHSEGADLVLHAVKRNVSLVPAQDLPLIFYPGITGRSDEIWPESISSDSFFVQRLSCKQNSKALYRTKEYLRSLLKMLGSLDSHKTKFCPSGHTFH